MARRILLINANPDPSPTRLAAALADAYQRGAIKAGHEIRRIDLGAISFPPVVTGEEHDHAPPEAIKQAQDDITWANHMVIVFPLWLGSPPSLLKSFFEQICRYGFSFDHRPRPLLKGRSARLVVTMFTPWLIFQLLFRSGVKGFARGVLWPSGFKPIRTLMLGSVLTAAKEPWFAKLEKMGERGD